MARKGYGRHGGKRVVAVTVDGAIRPKERKLTRAVYNQGEGPAPRKIMRLTAKNQKGFQAGSLVEMIEHAVAYRSDKLHLSIFKGDPSISRNILLKGTLMLVVKEEFAPAVTGLDDGTGSVYDLEKQFMLLMHGDQLYVTSEPWALFKPYVEPVPQANVALSVAADDDDEEDESDEPSHGCSSIAVDPA